MEFRQETVLKRDAFSETVLGWQDGRRVVLRRLDRLGPVGGRIGRWLAGREARALAAARGIEGVPELIAFDRLGLMRGWVEGQTLNLARPGEAAFYRDASRLLRAFRRRGITHNDLNKPQNWLMRPDGRAGVVDFQLARAWRRKGRLFRVQAYEDLRHLVKQKSRFAPHLMTPTAARLLARRSLPSRLWRHTGKRLYLLVTRRLLHWSDQEGGADRLRREGPEIEALLRAAPGVTQSVVVGYPLSGGGIGLYGFVETGLDPAALRQLLPPTRIELLQPVPALPLDPAGAPRRDLLTLIAANRPDAALAAAGPALRPLVEQLLAGRLNLSDRYARGRRGSP